jgi:nucleotide-binding universal stress UspA family protein
MQEKVLIPLDGSKAGEAALSALGSRMNRWSPEVKTEITLLGVITALKHWVVVGEASAPVPYTEEELKLIKTGVTNYLEKAGEPFKKHGAIVNTRVSTGNAVEEILKAADELKVDLIAMSTHGRSGLRRLAFGSVTDKVLREAKVPVLTVRAPENTANT